ncbi:hypothetical protein ATANTOWER_016810 [Ataeniobius toweri]|uniref:T. brucei spp.-specific protein n=1 Tax=Ataeniobius toweri TaxID=208326 RepID=A0ABU7A841_9TELE|nr:hypothetical protein [Ataeniobius toweri]
MRGDGIQKKKHEPCRKFFQTPLWCCHISHLFFKGIFCPFSFFQSVSLFLFFFYFMMLFFSLYPSVSSGAAALLHTVPGSVETGLCLSLFLSTHLHLTSLSSSIFVTPQQPSLYVGLFLAVCPV